MKTVLGYLCPHAGRVAAGAAIKFTAAVLELILPLLLAEIIDELVPAGDTAAIWRTGGWMSLLALGAVGCNITANRMAAWVSMEMTRVLRQDLYRRIQGLSCTQADQFSPSSLVSRLTNDTYNVHQMFDKVQRGGIRAPMLVLGGLILTFLLEPSLALVQLAVSLLTFLTITLVTRRGIPHYTRAQAAVDTVVRILRENAAGVRVVKALACQVRERDRFDTANQAQRQAEAQAGQVMALANPITDLLLNAGLILVVLVGALRVNAGLMPPGQIVAFMTYFTLIQSATLGLAKVFVKVSKGAASARRIQEVLLAPEQQRQTAPLPAGGGFLGMDRVTFSYQGARPDVEAASFLLRQGGMLGILGPSVNFINNLSLAAVSVFGALLYLGGGLSLGALSSFVLYSRKFSGPIRETAELLSDLQASVAAAERVLDLLDQPAEDGDLPGAREPGKLSGAISFCHVDFGYDPAHPVLRDFSADIPAGSMVAVVGPTGAGKTTLVSLLLRFYTPQKGSITIDGLPIQQYTRDGLRRRLAIVLQDGWLCGGTIAENIAYGVPGATRAQIEAAAKAACIHSFLSSLPDGYDTALTDSGAGLSKGQRQLLALARCFLSNADIVILDEATSDVDPETEEQISAALERLRRGRTCFLIAHRLATVRTADRILVLQDGRIAEQGTHQQLLDAGGIYRVLYDAQFS